MKDHVRIRFPDRMRRQGSTAIGTKLWINGTELKGVKTFNLSEFDSTAPVSINIELVNIALEIEYEDPASHADV